VVVSHFLLWEGSGPAARCWVAPNGKSLTIPANSKTIRI
jgi:hypothetical protein